MAKNRRARKDSTQKLNVIDISTISPRKRKIDIIPANLNQEDYLTALNQDDIDMVFAIGPAGTGKTMLATLWALKNLQEGKFKKIVITRPNEAVDNRDIGFLPGDIFDKMLPWTLPILDIFKEYGYTKEELTQMIANEIIELVPIAYVRGRTFKNAAVIIDEAQGTTPNSMLALLTRIGEGSKMIITGDVKQSDRGSNNGLQDFLTKFSKYRKSTHVELIRFEHKDIKRHDAVKEILEIYGEE